MDPATGAIPVAARFARASAIVGAVGVACLLGMFAGFVVETTSVAMTLGRINDLLILVAYPLALPGMLALRALVAARAPALSAAAAGLGVAAVMAIVVLQALLVLDVLTFEQQVGPVTLALLAFGASITLLGWIGRPTGVVDGGVRMGLIGATYLGFPLWARWLAQRLDGVQPQSALPPISPVGADHRG
jgi:hypothetical protein